MFRAEDGGERHAGGGAEKLGGVAEAHIDRGGVRDQPDAPAAEASKTLGGEEIETGADAGGHDVDSR